MTLLVATIVLSEPITARAALGGLIVLLGLHWFLHRRGFTIWAAASPDRQAADTALRLPTLRNAWWILLAALVVMVAGISLAVSAFGGG